MNINKNFLKQLIKEEMSKLEEVSFDELDVIFEDAVRSSLEKNFGVIVRELKSFTTEDVTVPSNLISVLNDIIYDMAEHIEDRDDYETLKDEMILPKYSIDPNTTLEKSSMDEYEDDVEIEVEEDVLSEAWKGDPEIEQTGEYAGKTTEELCAMKKKLMDKEKRTDAEQKKVRQINFAIRSKQEGPKFGKVTC